MTIKAVVSKLEDAPEAVRSLYVKVDDEKSPINGKFMLNVEEAEGYSLDAVDGLKTALSAEREKVKAANSAIEAFKGLDAKEVRKKLAKLEDLEKLDPEKEADKLAEAKAKTQIEQIKAAAQKDIDERDKKISTLSARIEKHFLDDAITKAVAEAEGSIKLLSPIIKTMTRLKETEDGTYIVEVLGENGVPRIKDATGALLGLNDFVAGLKKDPEYAALFKGDTQKSGTGTPPGQQQRQGTGKTMLRSDFEKLPPTEQMATIKGGTTITD